MLLHRADFSILCLFCSPHWKPWTHNTNYKGYNIKLLLDWKPLWLPIRLVLSKSDIDLEWKKSLCKLIFLGDWGLLDFLINWNAGRNGFDFGFGMYGELSTLGSPEAQKWVLAKNATLKHTQATALVNSHSDVKKQRLSLRHIASADVDRLTLSVIDKHNWWPWWS